MVNVSVVSFADAMNHEATKSESVSVHAQARERKESTALGEVSRDTFSDTGSTPVASTSTTPLIRYELAVFFRFQEGISK